MAAATSTETKVIPSIVLGFPRRFNSRTDDDSDPMSAIFLLNRLWKNASISMRDEGQCLMFDNTTTLGEQKIILPPSLPQNETCDNVLVDYIQNILDLNGYEDLIVVLDHSGDRNFQILTDTEFFAKLEYPIDEYRCERCDDGCSIIHPKIEYTWIWMARKHGTVFSKGSVDEFPKDSPCYCSSYGVAAH